MRVGYHAANVEPLQTDAMLAMPGECFTVVIAGPEHRDQARQIRAARPNATLLLRPYWGPCNVFADDQLATVDQCLELLGDLPETLCADVVIGNEPNVETPGFDNRDANHWRIAGLWLSVTNARAKLMRPNWRLHLCAPGPDAELQMETGVRQWLDLAHDLYSEIDAHAYWQRGNQAHEWEGMRHLKLRDLWQRPVWLSECGPVDVRDQVAAAVEIREWMRAQPAHVEACALFSWGWGANHPEFNYADKPALLASLRETMGGGQIVPTPEEVGMDKITIGPLFQRHAGFVVTRGFGHVDSYYADGWHKGTDFARAGSVGTEGAVLLAPMDCTVDGVWHNASRGWYVYLKADSGLWEYCAYHLMFEPALKPGQALKRGDVIGHLGKSGTTDAHLHCGLCWVLDAPAWPIDTTKGRAGWLDVMGTDVVREW
jgi:hypothetical protein